MTQAELVTLCKSLGFYGELDKGVSDSYYAILNPEVYTGPTLIYQPVEDPNVYICPEIHIEKKPLLFAGIHRMYTYDGVKDSLFSPMKKKIYPRYSLNDDEQIKNALVDLQKQWKYELNRIKEEELKGDFN